MSSDIGAALLLIQERKVVISLSACMCDLISLAGGLHSVGASQFYYRAMHYA